MTTTDKKPNTNSISSARSTVFVYGSLKAGFHNHVLLENKEASEFLGRAWLRGHYAMRDMRAYPGLYKHASLPLAYILGEVYRVTPDVLQALDILESNGFYYTRTKEIAQLHKDNSAAHEEVRAWCYFLPGLPEDKSCLESSQIQCWRPTADEHAFILSARPTPETPAQRRASSSASAG
jgi:gamma-glutamylcyclotransferase (GGCT)/AIG2-like uncharacterized protein YtfP